MLNPRPKQKILYFIDGPVPTKEERAHAASIGARAFRNARQVQSDDLPEDCEGVAGSVIPGPYKKFKQIDPPAPELPIQPETAKVEAPKVVSKSK